MLICAMQVFPDYERKLQYIMWVCTQDQQLMLDSTMLQ